MSDLTPKQERFVEEYLVDFNATQAAIRAGYSENTAGSIGHENLTKPEISAAIAAHRDALSKKVNAQWLLNRLADEANADMADLYDDNGNLRSIKEWPLVWRQGLVAGVEALEEFETVDGKKEKIGMTRKVKLADRTRIKELIGKHTDVRAFIEKVEHTGKNGAPLIPETQQTPDAVARRLLFLLEKGAVAAAVTPPG